MLSNSTMKTEQEKLWQIILFDQFDAASLGQYKTRKMQTYCLKFERN